MQCSCFTHLYLEPGVLGGISDITGADKVHTGPNAGILNGHDDWLATLKIQCLFRQNFGIVCATNWGGVPALSVEKIEGLGAGVMGGSCKTLGNTERLVVFLTNVEQSPKLEFRQQGDSVM